MKQNKRLKLLRFLVRCKTYRIFEIDVASIAQVRRNGREETGPFFRRLIEAGRLIEIRGRCVERCTVEPAFQIVQGRFN